MNYRGQPRVPAQTLRALAGTREPQKASEQKVVRSSFYYRESSRHMGKHPSLITENPPGSGSASSPEKRHRPSQAWEVISRDLGLRVKTLRKLAVWRGESRQANRGKKTSGLQSVGEAHQRGSQPGHQHLASGVTRKTAEGESTGSPRQLPRENGQGLYGNTCQGLASLQNATHWPQDRDILDTCTGSPGTLRPTQQDSHY